MFLVQFFGRLGQVSGQIKYGQFRWPKADEVVATKGNAITEDIAAAEQYAIIKGNVVSKSMRVRFHCGCQSLFGE